MKFQLNNACFHARLCFLTSNMKCIKQVNSEQVQGCEAKFSSSLHQRISDRCGQTEQGRYRSVRRRTEIRRSVGRLHRQERPPVEN